MCIARSAPYLTALTALGASAAVFHLAVRRYVSDIHRPELLQLGFWFMACVALSYDLGGSRSFLTNLRALARTMAMFAVAGVTAHWVRDAYIALVHSNTSDELFQVVGPEYATALQNRIVGYEGAFAMSLMFARLTIGRVLGRFARQKDGTSEAKPAGECEACRRRLAEGNPAL